MSNHAAIVFGRNPEAGRVKTRLGSQIGPQTAAILYRAFLLDTLDKCTDLPCDVRLYLEPTAEPIDAEIQPFDVRKLRQSGYGLGARMANAMARTLSAGYEGAIIVGSDLPTIPNRTLSSALGSLQTGRVVIVPSNDGGYGLLGLAEQVPELFDLKFGHSLVLEETMSRAQALKLEVMLLEPWYDVDTADDLARLVEELRHDPEHSPRTYEALFKTGLIENTRSV